MKSYFLLSCLSHNNTKSLKDTLETNVKEIGVEKVKKGLGSINIDATKVSIADSAEYFGERLEGVSKEPVRTPMLAELFRVRRLGTGTGAKVKYIEQDVVTRGADNIAFCGTFPSSDITFDTVEEPIRKIADSIIVCNDDLEDYDLGDLADINGINGTEFISQSEDDYIPIVRPNHNGVPLSEEDFFAKRIDLPQYLIIISKYT